APDIGCLNGLQPDWRRRGDADDGGGNIQHPTSDLPRAPALSDSRRSRPFWGPPTPMFPIPGPALQPIVEYRQGMMKLAAILSRLERYSVASATLRNGFVPRKMGSFQRRDC